MTAFRKGLVATVVSVALYGVAFPALAQSSAGKSAAGSVGGGTSTTYITVSKDLIGKNISNNQNAALGKIDEVILDSSGTAQYLIVAPARELNMAGKRIAVPWDAVTASKDGKLTLDISKDKFTKAPSWSKESAASADWNTKTYDYYGLVYIPEAIQFSQLDTNKDNQLSQDEAKLNRRVGTQFKNMDKDKNGNISQSEFSAFESVWSESPSK